MVKLDCMQGMIAGYVTSARGQEAIRNYLASPEGQKTIDRYLATPEGQDMAMLVLAKALDGLDLAPEVKSTVRAALSAGNRGACEPDPAGFRPG